MTRAIARLEKWLCKAWIYTISLHFSAGEMINVIQIKEIILYDCVRVSHIIDIDSGYFRWKYNNYCGEQCTCWSKDRVTRAIARLCSLDRNDLELLILLHTQCRTVLLGLLESVEELLQSMMIEWVCWRQILHVRLADHTEAGLFLLNSSFAWVCHMWWISHCTSLSS